VWLARKGYNSLWTLNWEWPCLSHCCKA